VTSRFGTVTFSLAALATSAASSAAVTHTSRRFFVPAGEFARRRRESRERGTSPSDKSSPNPSVPAVKKPSAATPKPGDPQASVPNADAGAVQDTPVYTRVNV
jgi:hypothetical protein